MLAAITRLVHDLGVTVVIAEHRLERVVQYADRVVHARRRRHASSDGDPADAARATSTSRRRSSSSAGSRAGRRCRCRCATRAAAPAPLARASIAERPPTAAARPLAPRPTAARARAASSCATATVVAVRDVDLDLRAGEVVALMGRNGVGQVVAAVGAAGLGRAPSGTVDVDGARPARRSHRAGARRSSASCRRRPSDLLYLDTVARRAARRPTRDAARTAGHAARCSTGSRPASPTTPIRATCPRASGSRSCSRSSSPPRRASCCSTSRPAASTTDAKRAARRHRRASSRPTGTRSWSSTHDVEFVAAVADRVVVLADGEIVADGPTADVVVRVAGVRARRSRRSSRPTPWLTVDRSRDALATAPTGDATAP